MRLFYGVVLALLLLIAGGIAFIYSGFYNVAASDPHAALSQWAIHTTMRNSVEARGEDIDVPDLDDQQMVAQGARSYDVLCAACHVKPGSNGTVLRSGLNPMPPALTEEIAWDPAEQFWIIKNGIKMTGMPAWGETHEDQELWEMVAFLQKLPELSEQQYSALVNPETSSSSGQADDGHDHEHGNMGGMMGSSSPDEEKPTQDDGHDHEHGDMGGMMTSSASGKDKNSPAKSTPPETASQDKLVADAKEPKSEDDHYADGHTH